MIKYVLGMLKIGIVKVFWDRIFFVFFFKFLIFNKFVGIKYGVYVIVLFFKEEDLKLFGFFIVEYFGYYYFDISSILMFDFNWVGFKVSVIKLDNVDVFVNVDKGFFKIGVVVWF